MRRLLLAQTHTCHPPYQVSFSSWGRSCWSWGRRGIMIMILIKRGDHDQDDDFDMTMEPLVHRSLSCISCKYWLWFKPNSMTFSSSSRCFCSGENLTPSSIFRRSSTSKARQEWMKSKREVLILVPSREHLLSQYRNSCHCIFKTLQIDLDWMDQSKHWSCFQFPNLPAP